MWQPLRLFIFIFSLHLVSACEAKITVPRGDVTLESLHFTPAVIEPRKPLVLIARPAAGNVVAEQPISFLGSGEGQHQGWLVPLSTSSRSPFDSLSDRELSAIIEAWDNLVFIGFKEADSEKGVDEDGRNMTSEETVEQMVAWIQEQGLSIDREWALLPGVTAVMQPTPELVSLIRQHPNTDYIEPAGIPGGPEAGTHPVAAPGFVGVLIREGGDYGSLFTTPGSTVTARYRQPDGSVLQATAIVR